MVLNNFVASANTDAALLFNNIGMFENFPSLKNLVMKALRMHQMEENVFPAVPGKNRIAYPEYSEKKSGSVS